MPEGRLARARRSLPEGYVYEPPTINVPPPLDVEVSAAENVANDRIICVHCERFWRQCMDAPCLGRVVMRGSYRQ